MKIYSHKIYGDKITNSMEKYRISKTKFEEEISELEKFGFYFRETELYRRFDVIVSTYDKDDIVFNFDVFNQIYSFNKLFDEYTDDLTSHKIDFMETDIFTYIAMKIDDIWKRFYTDEGFDNIIWYLYERSPFNDRTEPLNIYDSEGNVIDVDTPEKFYKYLNENDYERK